MAMSREQMDKVVNDHFQFEATDDIDGVMASFDSEGLVHEAVPSPVGQLTDPARVRAYYEMVFPAAQGESVTPIRRLYGTDFLVDETLWSGEISDGHWCLCDNQSGRATFRLLHVFEFRNDKISSEQVWLDLNSIQQQLQPADSA